MPNISIEKFDGGLNLTNPDTIGDNQFEVLTNMRYSASQRVETRGGLSNFGNLIPQSVTLIDACEATTGWAVDDDAVNLATGAAIRGSNSISFGITVATTGDNFATIERNNYSLNLSSTNGSLSFWIYVPTGFNTNLTDVRIRLSSDTATDYDSATNYYEWTLPTLTENSNNWINLLFSNATTTGSPDISSIKYLGLRVNYAASYTDKSAILLDAFYSYSSLSTKPVSSYFFDQRDDSGLIRAIAWCGTNAFLYHEGANVTDGYWEVIDTGLTENESNGNITRWSADTYKNVIYMCNGVDSYRSWNDTTITLYGSQPKVRYIKYLDDGDRMAGAGEDDNPSTLYYTDAAPADATALDANAVVIGGDQLGRINGLQSLGQVFVIGKDFKKYSVDITNEKALPLDPDSGWYANRSLQVVGRGILHQTERGVEELIARNALAGASAMESKALTDDLRPLINQIDEKYRNSSCALYIKELTNYYFTCDTTSDDIPETTIVRSASVSNAWSKYSYPAIYQYGIYIDSEGNTYNLAARATSGQMIQLESQYSDFGQAYQCELRTKAWDFGDPRGWKDFTTVYITGLKSIGRDINVEVIVDGDVAYSGVITDASVNSMSSGGASLGVNPIGTTGLAGSATSGTILPMYKYEAQIGGAQFSSGTTIQVRMYSNSTSQSWTLDQMQIFYDNNVFDLFPISNLI